jgi:hypothetical protein
VAAQTEKKERSVAQIESTMGRAVSGDGSSK